MNRVPADGRRFGPRSRVFIHLDAMTEATLTGLAVQGLRKQALWGRSGDEAPEGVTVHKCSLGR